MRKRKKNMMKISQLVLAAAIVVISGCTSIGRYAHMHSDSAPSPNTHQYQDGGTSIYYTFTTSNSGITDTLIFFYGGSGCPSWKSVMPGYVDGLSASARVFVLNKRFVSDKSTGVFGCGNKFHEANNMKQWFSDYSEFITAKLRIAKSPPRNVVLVGVSEGAITAVKVAGKIPEISHIAIIGDGGYSMRKSLTTLRRNGKTIFDVEAGWKKIEKNPQSIEDSWYGNPYRWWSEIMDYDPMPDYMKLNIPILLGIGEKDSSVPVESANYLASEYKEAGKSNLTLMVYKGANHQLNDGDKSYRSEFFKLLSQML